MKKIINTVLIAITIVLATNLDAKQMRKPIPVSKNTKQMFTDTKALKSATTPEEKKEAAEKLAKDIANDKLALLFIEEKEIQTDIATKKAEITKLGGDAYLSYVFASDELKEAQEELKGFEEELKVVQEELIKLGAKQPKEVRNLKRWAVYSLITAVGTTVALQLAGYNVAGTAITLAQKGWEYAPSLQGTWETTKSLIGYGRTAASLGLALFNIKAFAETLKDAISDEENQPNPDQEKLAKLHKQLEEQSKRIAELEIAIKKQPQ